MAKPPNLRFSDSKKDCSGCVGYKPNSQTCAMFQDYPVGPDLMCDDFHPIDPVKVSEDGQDS